MKIGIHFNAGVSQSLRQMNQLQGTHHRLIEQLATGKRINRAADDPSGVIAISHLESEAVKLVSKIDGLQRSNSVLATTEGALATIQDMLLQANSLITTLSNEAGLSDDERDAIELELNGIVQGINRVIEATTFNDQKILQGVLSFDLTDFLEEAQAIYLDEVESFFADQDIHTDLFFDPEPEEPEVQAGDAPASTIASVPADDVPVATADGLAQAVLESRARERQALLEQAAALTESQAADDPNQTSDTPQTQTQVGTYPPAERVEARRPVASGPASPASQEEAAPLPTPAAPQAEATPPPAQTTPQAEAAPRPTPIASQQGAAPRPTPPLAAVSPPVSPPVSPLEVAQRKVQNAGASVSTQRAVIGTQMRENETLARVYGVTLENTLAAKSQIEDLDYAKAISELTRTEILIQTNAHALALSMRQRERVVDILLEAAKPNRQAIDPGRSAQ